MKIYNLTLNAAQPIRQILNVPTSTDKYGIVVKSESIPTSNLSCSMVDGESTIYASNRGDGTFLFTLSSDGVERDRQVKVVLEAEATNIGGLSSEGGGFKKVRLIELPAGKYTNADLVDVGAKLHTAVTFVLPTFVNADLENLVGFAKINITGNGQASFADASNKPVADDVVVQVLAPTVFGTFKSVSANPYISPDVYLGENVASYHDVVLDESRFAVPDGDIEVPNPDIEVESVTIDGTTYPVEWKTITIGEDEYTVLAAKTTEG